MSKDLNAQIAWAMEADVRLLPLLPELLADLQELGTSAGQVVAALRATDLKAGSVVLDLGCGKGAVAVALAEQLGLRVEGIDGFAPFLQAARALAAERCVNERCSFREGDIRAHLGQRAYYDAVLLLSVGPVSGDHERTVADLRRLVRPGGYIVIEDAFLADGVAGLPHCEGYADRRETRRRLEASGDRIIREILCSAEETRSANEKNTGLIKKRAQLMKAKRPDLAALIDEYVARQERETEILGRDLICAVWVLQRSQDEAFGTGH